MGIPLVALQSDAPELAKIESPTASDTRVANAASARAGAAKAQLQLQQEQRAEADTQAAHKAYMDSGGDLEQFQRLAAQYGASPEMVGKVMKGFDEHKKSMLDMDEAQFKATSAKNALVADALDAVLAQPTEARADAWKTAVGQLSSQKALSPEEQQQWAEYPGDDTAKLLANARKTSEQLEKQAQAERARAALVPQDERQFQADFARQVAAGKYKKNAADELAYHDIWSKEQQAQKKTAALSTSEDDLQDTAEGIQEGLLPPILTTYSFRDRTALGAELKRAGYNVAEAERDYRAVNRYMSTLNGPQQVRLRQAVGFAWDSLDNIEDLYERWRKQTLAPDSGFKAFNKAGLAASKQLPGESGAVATSLEAQIADLTSELGTVYKGGSASTDESLKLAAKNLSGDWNEQTFKEALDNIRKNLRYRRNSIYAAQPAGVRADSPYVPSSEPPPERPAAATPAGGGAPSGGGAAPQRRKIVLVP